VVLEKLSVARCRRLLDLVPHQNFWLGKTTYKDGYPYLSCEFFVLRDCVSWFVMDFDEPGPSVGMTG
jgi:hypothetical protein